MTSGSRPAGVVAEAMTRAVAAWRRGGFLEARSELQSVLDAAPGNIDGKKMMALVDQRIGQHAEAVGYFRDVLVTLPHDESLHSSLAISLSALGMLPEATSEFYEATKLSPRAPYVWSNLGEALARQNAMDAALAALRSAVALDPGFVPAHLCMARVHAIVGDVDMAVSEFRKVLAVQPGSVEAWFGLSYLNMRCFSRDDVVRMRDLLAKTPFAPIPKERLAFALAKALEDTGDYEKAFREFQSANNLGKSRVRWNAAAEHRRIQAIETSFSLLASRGRVGTFGDEVIFIASLPRTGSTLVEAILASHPEVAGGSETRALARVCDAESRRRGRPFHEWISAADDGDWQRVGSEYMASIESLRTGDKYFTDKSLLNWELVGAALLALPGARVVLVERDAVETCLACFRQCLGTESGFACDMNWTADHYADFVHLSQFWLRKYADRIYHLRYEDLLLDPERVVRSLLGFCNLPFDESCLSFYRAKRSVLSLPSAGQVRQPLQTTTAKAHLYGHMLDGLRQRLSVAGLSAEGPNVLQRDDNKRR